MTKHTKRWLTFTFRSLLIVVTIVAMILGLWTRSNHLRSLAAEHHFKAMDAGYQAAAIQRPVDLQWEWKYPSQIKMDRDTIAEAAPFWQTSIYQAELRDLYITSAKQPWLPVKPLPPHPSPVVVPNGDEIASRWWHDSFDTYLQGNECLLESHMGFSASDQNLAFAETLLTSEQFSSLQTRFRERRGIDLDR